MDDPDDLYGLPLEQFIPERGALVKALRQDGDRERAKDVAAMRKPSVGAWAVNQLVRTKRKQAKELFDAGDALQHAQSELLEGRGDGKTLREAVAREREAVDELSAQARGLLSADGHELTPATLEKVSDTLHAAALDPAAREQVEGGRLERELRHVGMGPFGGGLSAAAPTRPKRSRKQASGRSTSAPDAAEDKRRREAEKEAERQRAAALKARRQAERDARRAAQRAERDLQAAEARHKAATTALSEAEDALRTAREQAERTRRAHEEAEAEIERVSGD